MPIGMSRSVRGNVSRLARLAHARRGHRAGESADDRLHQRPERPDCGHADGARRRRSAP